MRSYQTLLVGLMLTLVGCSQTSKEETRFLKDRSAVIETVRLCFEQPYDGLSRTFTNDASSNLDFPGEDHIRNCARSRVGWYSDDYWQVIYHPTVRDGDVIGHPPEVDKLLEFYFSRLEAAGFTSGMRGTPLTTTETLQSSCKSWANYGRTLLVTAHVVSDRSSGETIITTIMRERLNL